MWANNGGRNAKDEYWWMGSRGYIEGRVTMPDGSKRRVKLHRWLAEQKLGRRLESHEVVHHMNGDKSDNRPENLQLMNFSEHSSHHNEKRAYAKGYKLNLTDEQRKQRSDRAKKMNLAALGRAAIAIAAAQP